MIQKNTIFKYVSSILQYTMLPTTIKINYKVKNELDNFRENTNESYNEVISKIIYIAKNIKTQPELSLETINAIESARKRVKAGKYISEEMLQKRLGF